MKRFGERNGQCNMKRYFNITKTVLTRKGYCTQVTTYENPVELIIDPIFKTFQIDDSFKYNFNEKTDIIFITENNSIIKYRDNKLTIVSEQILK